MGARAVEVPDQLAQPSGLQAQLQRRVPWLERRELSLVICERVVGRIASGGVQVVERHDDGSGVVEKVRFLWKLHRAHVEHRLGFVVRGLDSADRWNMQHSASRQLRLLVGEGANRARDLERCRYGQGVRDAAAHHRCLIDVGERPFGRTRRARDSAFLVLERG